MITMFIWAFLANCANAEISSYGELMTEISPIQAPLTKFSYRNLSSSKHGRHLLLISQLEELNQPYWFPRSDGKLLLFLPSSLAPDDQPPVVSAGQELEEITRDDGAVVTREKVIALLNKEEDFLFMPDKNYIRLNHDHMEVVKRIVNMLVSQGTFDNMFSMLVTLKEFLPIDVFVDSIYSLIQRRKDVGFIIPSAVSVQPEDFFPSMMLESILGSSSSNTRNKRQAVPWASGQMVDVDYGYRTLPDSEPESKMWYFREDPMVNANHFHWHKVISNDDVFSNDPMHSSNLDRRGEMFYFMHRQLLCRANLERLSVGLEVSKPYGPEQWALPLYPGYDPMLGLGAVKKYSPRPGGALMFASDARKLSKFEELLRNDIGLGWLLVKGSWLRMVYEGGVDKGISSLGDVIESYTISKYGDLHNTGHTIISDLHKGMGEGVMATPNVALRDPVFSRWHKYIDDIFMEYKNNLGYYTDQDLDYPGVTLSSVSVKTDKDDDINYLHTYMNSSAFVQLWSLDLTKAGSSSVGIHYTRLDNFPFTYNFEIESSQPGQGMLRVFLIPAEIPSGPQVEVSQLAVELDRFHVSLTAGVNTIARKSGDSSFLAKKRWSLYELQKKLISGEISEDEFNWGGCGWPEEMLLPRGTEAGMKFDLFVVLSPLLEEDSAHSADWGTHSTGTWSWCGVRKDKGGMPDSRPMGFPLDRSPPADDWRSLLVGGKGVQRRNMVRLPVIIKHTP